MKNSLTDILPSRDRRTSVQSIAMSTSTISSGKSTSSSRASSISSKSNVYVFKANRFSLTELDFASLVDQLNSYKAEPSWESNEGRYRTTVESLITLLNFIDKLKTEFDSPITSLRSERVFRLVELTSKIDDDDKDAITALRSYSKSINGITSCFSTELEKTKYFQYNAFVKMLDEFPNWDVTTTGINLQIANNEIKLVMEKPKHKSEIVVKGFESEIEYFRNLWTKFSTDLESSVEIEHLIENLIDNISQKIPTLNISKKNQILKERRELFTKLNTNLATVRITIDSKEFSTKVKDLCGKINKITTEVTSFLKKQIEEPVPIMNFVKLL